MKYISPKIEELSINMVLLALSIYLMLNMGNWIFVAIPTTVDPSLLPRIVSCIITGCTLFLVYSSFLSMLRKNNASDDIQHVNTANVYYIFLYVAILLSYVIMIYYIGFLISTPLTMLAVSLMLGIRRWMVGLACYIVFSTLLYYTCLYLMNVILPSGVLFS